MFVSFKTEWKNGRRLHPAVTIISWLFLLWLVLDFERIRFCTDVARFLLNWSLLSLRGDTLEGANGVVLPRKLADHRHFNLHDCCQLELPFNWTRFKRISSPSRVFFSFRSMFFFLCRMFGSMKRCARCHAAILASELVMRARDLVFHVRCFSCAACAVPLTKGDHFGMRDGAVLCRLHYEMGAELHPSQSPPVPVYPPGPHYPGQPFPSPEFLHHHHHHPPHPHHSMHPQHPHSHVSPVPLQPSTPSVPDAGSPPKVPYFNGAAVVPPPRQKGRPRKRKPKDLEAMTANIGEWRDTAFRGFGGGQVLGRYRQGLLDATWCTERMYVWREEDEEVEEDGRRIEIIGYNCLIREKRKGKSLCGYVYFLKNVSPLLLFSRNNVLSCWSRRCHDFWTSFWLRSDSFAFSAARARFIKSVARVVARWIQKVILEKILHARINILAFVHVSVIRSWLEGETYSIEHMQIGIETRCTCYSILERITQ